MKIILFPLLLFSIAITAQEKRKNKSFFKSDTLKNNKEQASQKTVPVSKQKSDERYKIMVLKLKDTNYLALKEPKKDYSKYKILNRATPKNSDKNIKEAITPK